MRSIFHTELSSAAVDDRLRSQQQKPRVLDDGHRLVGRRIVASMNEDQHI